MHQLSKKAALAAFFAVFGLPQLGACSSPDKPADALPAATAQAAVSPSSCGDGALAEMALYGVIETQIRWSGEDMVCDSMPRPNGEGIRLRIVGTVADERLAIIIALPELTPDASAVEVPSNVTATVEGSGRFFSTPNLTSCWTEVESQTRLADHDDATQLQGILFCIAPLGEINGDTTVSIPELRFSTLIDWSAS